jgi:hypothetical protein
LNIFYNKDHLSYHIYRKYNGNLYTCFIIKNKYNKKNIGKLLINIEINNKFKQFKIFDYSETKLNIYNKIDKNIMKDLLFIKKEFINDFIIKNVEI